MKKIVVIGFKRDEGLCREYYREIKFGSGGKRGRLFCRQPDPNGELQWHICSKDGEPCSVVPAEQIKTMDTTYV